MVLTQRVKAFRRRYEITGNQLRALVNELI
jgi:hypothetical protein